MPTNLKLYRVFIASPGGLEKERSAFRNALLEYNEIEAMGRGIYFQPYGWELTKPGMGRPQQLINRQIEESDYFILLLWDRWGTAPSTDGPFTSGTEEEFDLACRLHRRSTPQILDIGTYFKSVDLRRLADPGEQLSKVLAFKEKLEKERSLLYKTFDDEAEFQGLIGRLLATWARAHEITSSGIPAPKITLRDAAPAALSPSGMKFALTEDETATAPPTVAAEGDLATRIVNGDAGAVAEYARYLIKSGRFRKAKPLLEEAVRSESSLSPNKIARFKSLKDLAILAQNDGNFSHAESLLQDGLKAMGTDEAVLPQKIALMTDLAGLYVEMGRFSLAKPLFDQILILAESNHLYRELSLATFAQSQFDRVLSYYQDSAKHAEMSEAAFKKTGEASVPTGLLIGVCDALLAVADEPRFVESIAMLTAMTDVSLEFDCSLKRILGVRASRDGNFEEAEKLLRQSLDRINEAYGLDHFRASSVQVALAGILRVNKKFEESEDLIRRAMASREKRLGSSHPFYLEAVHCLAAVFIAQDAFVEARSLCEVVEKTLAAQVSEEAPSVGMSQYLQARVAIGLNQRPAALGSLQNSIRKLRSHLPEAHPLCQEILGVTGDLTVNDGNAVRSLVRIRAVD